MYEFTTAIVGLVVLMFFVQEAALQSPVLTLNPAWRKFYPTEKVTLKCEIKFIQTERSYLWYRDGTPINSTLYRGNEFTIPALDQSHSGRYSCRGAIPGRDFHTQMSKDVTLIVDGEAPKPLLTLDPPSGEIFTGDTVILSRRFGTDPVGMEYLWFKDTLEETLTSTDSSSTDGSRYTIHSAAVSHGGEYWCRAGRGSPTVYTPYSDSLQLSITENLFGDREHVSNEEQSTEANAACSIELYSILELKKNTEVLPPKQNPEDLTSFKAGQ